MNFAIKNEWLKLRKQKKALVLFILTLVATLVLTVANFYMNSVTGVMVIDSDEMALSVIGILGGLLLPLVAFIMAVDHISTEVSSGTLKFGFMAPISRTKLFLAKLISLVMYNAVVLAGVFVISFTLNILTMTGNVFTNLLIGLLAYIITLIPLTLVSLWGLLIGMHFSSGLSLGIGIIGVFGLNVAGLFLPVLGRISPIEYMDLFSKVIYNNAAFSTMATMLLYLCSYYIILVALNLLRLNQKEV